MRKLLTSVVITVTLFGGFALGAGLSSAGLGPATMQAVPAESEAAATVTVSNVADPASRCEVPRGNGVAGIGNGGATSQVSLDLTSTNGTMQMDAVTPEGNGDWSQTYTDLEVGTYTVTGSCDVLIVDPTGGFSPDRAGPFTYIPVEFVVKAPSGTTAGGADTEQPAPGGGAVRATPSFTG